jgi:Fe-S cluster assembly protein SufD
MTQLAERHETYVTAFEALKRDAAFGRGPLAQSREAAFDRFLSRGLPTTRDEEWRFTSLAPLANTTFGRAPAAPVAAPVLEGLSFADSAAATIVVSNGRVVSGARTLPAGVTVRTIADARDRELVPARPQGGTAFAELNQALFEDLVVIEIAPKAVVRQSLHVLHVAQGLHGAAVLASPRLVIVAGEQSQASIVESYATVGGDGVFVNAATDVQVGAGALVDHVKLQRQDDSSFHLASVFVTTGRGGTFTSHAVTLGGRIARNDIISVLGGDGAECTLNGLYVAVGDSLVDTHTTIDHAQPHCPSHEVYKGILAGRARAVFNGKINVRLDAQKTDAKQTNKALLLTDDAQINTKPQLEIFADDVKCTHGAAIGQLDEDALFYLKARGIGAVEARNMLIHAFAGDVLDGITSEQVRHAAMRVVEEKLGLL